MRCTAMFLDDTHGWPRREDSPPRPRPPFRHERALTRLMFAYAIVLLLLPVSLGGIVDLIAYLFG